MARINDSSGIQVWLVLVGALALLLAVTLV